MTPLSGSVAPGAEITLEIAFASAGLAVGEYEAEIAIQTNDPFAPVLTVPVTFSVLERPGRLGRPAHLSEPGAGHGHGPAPGPPPTATRRPRCSTPRAAWFATIFDGPLEDGYPTLAWDASGVPAGPLRRPRPDADRPPRSERSSSRADLGGRAPRRAASRRGRVSSRLRATTRAARTAPATPSVRTPWSVSPKTIHPTPNRAA